MPIDIDGVTDPDGDPVAVTVTSIAEDERPAENADESACPDAVIVDGRARVRSERSGGGNGRVYSIHFHADDGRGGACDGIVKVCVPHDRGSGRPDFNSPPSTGTGVEGSRRSESTCVEDSPLFDAVGPCSAANRGRGVADGLSIAAVKSEGRTLRIEYSLPAAGEVRLDLYDITGRRVAALLSGFQSEGVHQLSWNPPGLEQGMYFYRLSGGGATVSRSFLILK